MALNDPRRRAASRHKRGSSTRARTQRVRNAGRTPMKNTARQPHRGSTSIVTSAAAA